MIRMATYEPQKFGQHWDVRPIFASPECVPVVAQWQHEQWLAQQLQEPDWSATHADLIARQQWLKSHSAEALPATWVVLDEDEPIAAVSLVEYSTSGEKRKSLWLTNLFVVESQRRKGIGSRLVDLACLYAADQVDARGNPYANLSLFTFDQAPFYLSRGWEQISRQELQGRKCDILRRPIIR